MRLILACAALAVPAALVAATDTLRSAVATPSRDPAQVARDGARKPVETLAFLGVKPDSSVVEIWPGTRPYWTPILAAYLHDSGRYRIALGTADGTRTEQAYAKLPAAVAPDPAARPAGYDKVEVTRFGSTHPDPAPAGSVDIVLTFRNLHNWLEDRDADALLAGIHRALKPGGILGIEDHRARPDRPQDPTAEDGYVRQDYAVALVERAGFKLVGSSELLANPRDTTHWPKGVWTLPPTLAMGDTDRARYQAIGEADGFLLKFRKVATR